MNMHAEPPRAPRADLPTRVLLVITGVDEDTLRRCPASDWSACRALGLLLVLQAIYLAALFSLFVHSIFTPLQPLKPLQVLVAAFASGFVIAIDSYMVVRSGWFLSGIAELKKAGYDISGGRAVQVKAGIFLLVRLILSIGLAQLTAVCLSLLIFGGDISAGINNRYQQENARLITQAQGPVDQDVRAARELLTAEETRHKALAAQAVAARQTQLDPLANDPRVQEAQAELTRLEAQRAQDETQVRQAEQFATNELGGIKGSAGNSGHAGNGPKHRAALAQLADAKRHAAETANAVVAARRRIDDLRGTLVGSAVTTAKAVEQTTAFEQALTAETQQLDQTRQDYEAKLAGRNAAIQRAIESAPDYVPPATGFLTQIKLLEEIAGHDNKVTTIIILIDVVSFGFELAAVLAKVTSYVPTTYASLLASEVYLGVSRIGEALAAELKASGQDEPSDTVEETIAAAPIPPNSGATGDELFTPPKRGRGRPRKATEH